MTGRKQKTSKGYLPHLRRNYNKGQVARCARLLEHVLRTGQISLEEASTLEHVIFHLDDILGSWPAVLSGKEALR